MIVSPFKFMFVVNNMVYPFHFLYFRYTTLTIRLSATPLKKFFLRFGRSTNLDLHE